MPDHGLAYRGRFLGTVVPPLFEATGLLPYSDTETYVRYPILLTAESRAFLLMFRMPLTSPFHKSFLTGSHLPRLSSKEINMCTLLVQRFSIFTFKSPKLDC